MHLGIYEAPLTAVANLMLVLLGDPDAGHHRGGGRRHLPARAAPVRRRSACCAIRCTELANGRYDYRIADTRKDEFGELYAGFDQTAAALEKRHEPPAVRPAAAASAISGCFARRAAGASRSPC